MKLPKMLTAGLLALSASGAANAQTVVHLTGSTAFRAATVTAITHILQPGFTYAYAGTSFTGGNQQIFTGSTISNNIPVIIKTSWTGSVGGVETVSQQLPISTWLTNTTAQSVAGTANAPSVYDPPAVPEVAMSDGFQSSTPYPAPALIQQSVGVVPFKWVCSAGSPASLNNITPQLAQALFLNGSLPLALFTGNNADEGTSVFAIGRDADSGTRLSAFAETGVGVFTAVTQYAPTNSSGAIISRTAAGPIAGQEPEPAETINGIFYPVGQGGYSSGGDLAVAMEASGTLAAIKGYYVTYLGTSDATNAVNGGAIPMSYNGVAYGINAIEEGQYTFWGYEHLDYRANYGTVDANGKAVADLIAAQITTTDAPVAGVLNSTMRVLRPTDGGLVTPKY